MNAFLFPGQGSQEVGMAADLFRDDAAFRALIDQASAEAGEDLERLCLRGPERKLCRTTFLQPLLVAVSLGYLRHVTGRGLAAGAVLGHSLGEITALAAAGVVSEADAIRIAARRGVLMDRVASQVEGGMMAVTLTDRERVLALAEGVTVANDNAPNQVVLSGALRDLEAVAARIAAEQAGRCRSLAVAGPWHSPYLADARREFAEWVAPLVFHAPRTTLILNATGEAETDPAAIKRHVTDTLAGPVRWRSCMDSLRRLAPDTLLEIGPGRVLAGLARANGFDDRTRVLSVNNLRGLDRLFETPTS